MRGGKSGPSSGEGVPIQRVVRYGSRKLGGEGKVPGGGREADCNVGLLGPYFGGNTDWGWGVPSLGFW